jgi:hypothetical protein
MKKFYISFLVVALAIVTAGTVSWQKVTANNKQIVGSWFVKAPDAPFKYHMFLFSADGTMEQANPDAGDANTSDSDGKGVWERDGNTIKGKFVEVTADRTTHEFVSRGEISFTIDVNGDHFTGHADARFYDVNNNLFRGPLPTALEGSRVTLP